MRRTLTAACCTLLLVGCSEGARPAQTRAARVPTRSPSSSPTERPDRKHRYIPIARAIARLERHVDLDLVLPKDRFAGFVPSRGWRADPRYLDWDRTREGDVATLVLSKGRNAVGTLWIHYGRAEFDGCGGRETAVETNVVGQPALVKQSRESEWSRIIWPVSSKGSTGRFGLSGTFEAWEMVRLAESMQLDAAEVGNDRTSC